MKRILSMTLLPLALTLLLSLGACTDGDSAVATSVAEAEKRGRNDAVALAEANYKKEADLHAALLAVKSREWDLRRQGADEAAEAYINSFKAQLSEADAQLAGKVF